MPSGFLLRNWSLPPVQSERQRNCVSAAAGLNLGSDPGLKPRVFMQSMIPVGRVNEPAYKPAHTRTGNYVRSIVLLSSETGHTHHTRQPVRDGRNPPCIRVFVGNNRRQRP